MTAQINSLESLIQEQQELLRLINERQLKQKQALIEIQALMQEHKFTPADVQASFDEDRLYENPCYTRVS